MLRLLLVDDHAAYRGILTRVLNLQLGMEVVAQCGSLSECRALGGLGAVDVALLDLNLPDGEGTELVAVLRGANPVMRVLMLSAGVEPRLRERAAEVGADGVLDKMTPLPELASEIGRVAGSTGLPARPPEASFEVQLPQGQPRVSGVPPPARPPGTSGTGSCTLRRAARNP